MLLLLIFCLGLVACFSVFTLAKIEFNYYYLPSSLVLGDTSSLRVISDECGRSEAGVGCRDEGRLSPTQLVEGEPCADVAGDSEAGEVLELVFECPLRYLIKLREPVASNIT